jgi:hypothetical protein
MGLDNSVELELAKMDLNEPVLEPITFEDDIPLKGSSSTTKNPQIGLDVEDPRLEERVVVVALILMMITWRTTYSLVLWDYFIYGSSIYLILYFPLVFPPIVACRL